MNYPEEFKQKVLEFVDKAKGTIEIKENVEKSLEHVDRDLESILLSISEKKYTGEDIINAYQNKDYFDKLYKTALLSLEAKKLLSELYILKWDLYFGSKKR